MAKRVMRSNRRTQRRRGSQLKQRKKRSKLLKRTLKRRNSFRKKNTYKRRKTNMKRGGNADPVPLKNRRYYGNVHKFAHFYEEHCRKGSRYIFNELTKLLNLRGVSIFVERKTILGGKRKCRVINIEHSRLRDDFVRFENEGECKRKHGDFRRHGITLDNLIDNYFTFVEEDEDVGVKLCFYHKNEALYSYAAKGMFIRQE